MKYTKYIVLGLLSLTVLLIVAGCSPTPAVWPGLTADGEAVYVTLLDGKLYALNPDDGSEMWTFPPKSERESGLGCAGPAQSSAGLFASPVLTEESVFVGGYDGQVYVLDKTSGAQQRFFPDQGKDTGQGLSGFFSVRENPAIIGSLALDGDTLYIPSASQNLYAVNVTNGVKQWSFQADNAIWATPLVTKDRIYVAAMDHHLYGLDKETGKEVWRPSFDAKGAIPSTPALAEDTIYLCSLAGKVFAVDVDTGKERWSFPMDGPMDSWGWAAPLVVSDTVYVSEIGGTLYALDAETGAKRWEFPTQGKIQATPAYADGTLYLAAEDGNIYVLDAATGEQQRSPFTAPEERVFMTTPALVDGTLYAVAMNTKNPADSRVYALDAESGAQKWVYDPTLEE